MVGHDGKIIKIVLWTETRS